MNRSIWIGYDAREAEAFAVCRHSLKRYAHGIPIHAVVLDDVREVGLYNRPTSFVDGKLWDDISEAPMSTEFAISRFLVPHIARSGWALFIDCDFMARADLQALFAQADPSKAVMCVKHVHVPLESTKMDNQAQLLYQRKNWSSCMLFNCDHPANQKLTVDMINSVPGRDLHRFCWLEDEDIGSLDPIWNYLVGYTKLPAGKQPKLVHWTSGGPWFPDYRDVEFADEWRAERRGWLIEDAFVKGRPSTWLNQWNGSLDAHH